MTPNQEAEILKGIESIITRPTVSENYNNPLTKLALKLIKK